MKSLSVQATKERHREREREKKKMFKGVRDLWRREFFPFFFLSIDKFFADFLPFPRFFFLFGFFFFL